MSTECLFCKNTQHAHGLCNTHYRRFLRHGDPHVERKPRCQACLDIYRVISRPGNRLEEILEKYAEILLIYGAKAPYLLYNEDKDGRKVNARFRRVQDD